MAVAVILHVALAGVLHDALRVEDVLPEHLLAVVLTPGGSPRLQLLPDHRDDVTLAALANFSLLSKLQLGVRLTAELVQSGAQEPSDLLIVRLGLELQLTHVVKVLPEYLGIDRRLEALLQERVDVLKEAVFLCLDLLRVLSTSPGQEA